MARSLSVTIPRKKVEAMRTNVTILPTSAQEPLQLSHKYTVLFFLYPALPILSSSRYKYLLGICGHGSIEILLTFDVQASRHLSTLACWCRAGLDKGKRWRCDRYVYPRRVSSPRPYETGWSDLSRASATMLEDEHGLRSRDTT